jgi:hypothetical protein
MTRRATAATKLATSKPTVRRKKGASAAAAAVMVVALAAAAGGEGEAKAVVLWV